MNKVTPMRMLATKLGNWPTLESEFKRGYQKAYRAGTNHGIDKAINTCMALGRLNGKPYGYYKALREVINNLELRK
jgi:hypothetical protein